MGGAPFLIPYFVCFFLIAVPLFLIETAYGQLITVKLHARWGAIVPRLWGVKIIQVCTCFFVCIYYITLMAWSFSFFFASFRSPLPWMKEISETNVTNEINATDLWDENYFIGETLRQSKDINV